MTPAQMEERMELQSGRDAFKVPPAVEFVSTVGQQGWTVADDMWQKGNQRKEAWPLFLGWERTGARAVTYIEAQDCKSFGHYMIMIGARYVGDDTWEVMDGDTSNYYTTAELYIFFKSNKRPS
jgi:hypothetical protein